METKKEILIVDDEEIVRRMLASFFKPYFESSIAMDAFNALSLLFDIQAERFPAEFEPLEKFLHNQTRLGIQVHDQRNPLKFRPELIVSDIKMPQINGFQLIHLIRPYLPEVPVILITGYDVELSKEEIYRLNITEVMTKPFSPAKLLGKIRELLQV